MNKSYLTFSLENFEGPLELLLHLIQKDEIDVCAIALKNLTVQLIQALERSLEIETNSDLLSLAASLLLIKSQKLLPQENGASEEIEEEARVELIQSLLEYCRFKEAAKNLSSREETQKAHFLRAVSPIDKELGPGLEEISISQLKTLVEDILQRSSQIPSQIIKEEEWQVSHKLEWLQKTLNQQKKILFDTVFEKTMGRGELIVLLLAVLEMMKHQEARVVKENEKIYIIRAYASGT